MRMPSPLPFGGAAPLAPNAGIYGEGDSEDDAPADNGLTDDDAGRFGSSI
ncbi:hypothetical protein I3842_01G120300 [Carya illinoinensis]|uniref:Uncharacterized protein n=1 Tax=Carya illinoinensis TaxID=32201 RepID=A0A922FZJ3_CARIL|nr:hypothetical protein I3842_01G120300 [Carya illinoinensis]